MENEDVVFMVLDHCGRLTRVRGENLEKFFAQQAEMKAESKMEVYEKAAKRLAEHLGEDAADLYRELVGQKNNPR